MIYKKKTKENWQKIWSGNNTVELFEFYKKWDPTSEEILKTIIKESKIKNQTVLEQGSGTGKISLKLSELGGEVTLLDIVPETINKSKFVFSQRKQKANFIVGSIFEFVAKGKFDLIWNAGLIEHFSISEQKNIFKKTAESIKKGGKYILFTPYSKGLIYRLGKFIQESSKRWIYGYEKPIKTVRGLFDDSDYILLNEYPIGFDLQFEYLYPPIFRKIMFKFFKIFPKKNREGWLKNIFGGYLLVSVLKKK